MDFTKLTTIKPSTIVEVKRIKASQNGGISASFKAFLDTKRESDYNTAGQLFISYNDLLPLLKDFESNEIDKIEQNDNLNEELRKMFGFARYLNKNNEFKKTYKVTNSLHLTDELKDTKGIFRYNGEFYNALLVVRK